ncbi:MAG: TetR/AcrR family transcriptional regulator [Clostridium sp.]|nr:TetR/AcrR family transcriptional regulator [Clostridium sp.]
MDKDIKDNVPTKIRILKAAEEIFAQKGYDGSSVNEIAKKAQISKTQVFYYFNNKRELFNGLIEYSIKSGLEKKTNLWKNINPKSSKEKVELFGSVLKYVTDNKKNIIRIGLTESFKDNTEDIPIFKLLDPIFKDSIDKLRDTESNIIGSKENTKFNVNMLFFAMMPLYTFAILNDKFCDYYNVDSEETKEIFKEAFEMSLKYIIG